MLRPTWHFVLPADIRWLLTATAPRIKARSARRYRQLGLDDGDAAARAAACSPRALRGGNAAHARARSAGVLEPRGIGVDGQRLPYLLMHAELDALICSGPRRGKQHTYMLLEERAPDARDLPRDEALAELARRFFAGHGPATAKDFATWASLTLAEARAAIEAAGPALRREDLGRPALLVGARAERGERAGAALAARAPRPGLRRVHHGLHRDQARARPAGLAVGAGDAARSSSSSSCWTAGSPASGGAALKRDVVVVEVALLEDRSSGRRRARRSRPRPPATARSSVCPRTSGSCEPPAPSGVGSRASYVADRAL